MPTSALRRSPWWYLSTVTIDYVDSVNMVCKVDGVNIARDAELVLNRRVPTRVGTLAAADHGEGPAVVLWPSLFSDHRLYREVTELLGREWRTICIDGPGFGRSSPPAGDVQPDRYAGAVVDLLDELEIEAAVIAGCSWGGQVAAHVGAKFPERTKAVLLMNTPLAPGHGGRRFLILGTRALGSTTLWGRGVARSMMARRTIRSGWRPSCRRSGPSTRPRRRPRFAPFWPARRGLPRCCRDCAFRPPS